MARELHKDLFRNPSKPSILGGEKPATMDKNLQLELKVKELENLTRQLQKKSLDAETKINSMLHKISDGFRTAQNKYDRVHQGSQNLEKHVRAAINDYGAKLSSLVTRITENRSRDQKIERLIERHNQVVQEFEVKVKKLQKVISEQEMKLMNYQSTLKEIQRRLP